MSINLDRKLYVTFNIVKPRICSIKYAYTLSSYVAYTQILLFILDYIKMWYFMCIGTVCMYFNLFDFSFDLVMVRLHFIIQHRLHSEWTFCNIYTYTHAHQRYLFYDYYHSACENTIRKNNNTQRRRRRISNNSSFTYITLVYKAWKKI